MLTKILEIRNIAIDTYRKVRHIVNPVIKFIVALLVFSNLNSAIGTDPRFTKTSIVLLLSLVSAVTPGGVMVFFAMALTLLHVYNASLYLAILVLLIFMVLYATLMRFSNGNAIIAVLIPLLAPLNLHYAVPLILGCVATPVAIMPCACGVVFYYLIDVIKNFSGINLEKVNVDILIDYYNDLLNVIVGQKEMYIVIVVFALVILTVFLLRRLPFDYSFLISIGAGAVVNIIGFLVGSLKFNLSISVGTVIFMTLICALIAVVSDFMKRVLDYTAIEHVQFEDDDFYYYVKAVPKIKISMTNHNIRILSTSDDVRDSDEYPDDEDYVSAYSEQAPGYDLYNGYDDEDAQAQDDRDDYGRDGEGYEGEYDQDGYYDDNEGYEEDENMAMRYAMSDVKGDYESDFEEEMDIDDDPDGIDR
ncbi:MAG: hypothetical protein K6F93_03320 [Lachnospiraceae bacterium]|nr:hypothetical protein [Lachnospiraceae bacterium]